MPVLGLVLLLDDGSEATRQRVAGALARAGDLDLGEANGHRWPAVLESATTEEVEERVRALRDVAGVASVDVVYADFEDLLPREAPGSAREVT